MKAKLKNVPLKSLKGKEVSGRPELWKLSVGEIWALDAVVEKALDTRCQGE
jgi:hypothetical protein